jgi:multiple sugar transport system permease protein
MRDLALTSIRKKRSSLESYRPWVLPVTIVVMAIAFAIMFFLIYLSFEELDPVSHTLSFQGVNNWVNLIQDDRAINALTVTVKYTVVCLVIESFLGLGIALAVNSITRGQSVFRSIFILPMMMTPVVTALIFQLMYHPQWGIVSYYLYQSGLLTPQEPLLGGMGVYALPSVMSVDIWQWTPFIVLILFAGLHALPQSPFRAARVDGASAWQTFRFITLPLLKPIIALVLLLRFIDLFRTFDYVYVMTAGGPVGGVTELISFYAFKISFGFVKWGYGATMLLLILIVILVLCNVIVKYAKIRF